MALANIAILLSSWKYRVLLIDWDLEAPGLESFYKQYISLDKIKTKHGLIDLLESASNEKSSPRVNWKECVTTISLDSKYMKNSQIDLITSGKRDDNYYDKVRAFDFASFYENQNGGAFIENLRNEWKEEYDFVLVDSRTGVTDIGGVCTIQLPDILVLLFTPTNQSFEGIKSVSKKSLEGQKRLPYDRINLLTLPIASRIDNSEHKLTQMWYEKFETGSEELFSPWFPKSISVTDFIVNTKIPYKSFFSFEESLPVIEEGVNDPTSMGYSYESIAALIATQLDHPKLLLDDRTSLLELAENPDLDASAKDKIVNANISKDSRKSEFVSKVTRLGKRVSNYQVSISILILMLAFLTLSFLYVINDYRNHNLLLISKIDSVSLLNLNNNLLLISKSKIDSVSFLNLELEKNLKKENSKNFNLDTSHIVITKTEYDYLKSNFEYLRSSKQREDRLYEKLDALEGEIKGSRRK